MAAARGAHDALERRAARRGGGDGAAKVDITPARVDGRAVVGHRRPVTGVRDPLRAGVLVLDDGDTRAANVTLDTIGA